MSPSFIMQGKQYAEADRDETKKIRTQIGEACLKIYAGLSQDKVLLVAANFAKLFPLRKR
jgi:hypothetical protein